MQYGVGAGLLALTPNRDDWMSTESEEIRRELKTITADIGNIKLETALTRSEVSNIKVSLLDLKTDLDKNFVTFSEYSPVQKLVYGAVAIVGTAILIALLSLIDLRKAAGEDRLPIMHESKATLKKYLDI